MEFKPLVYEDNDCIKMPKAELNAIYGRKNMTIKDYIVVHRAKRPVIIFKKFIMSVEMNADENRAIIYCSDGSGFYADEKYSDVIKQLV